MVFYIFSYGGCSFSFILWEGDIHMGHLQNWVVEGEFNLVNL